MMKLAASLTIAIICATLFAATDCKDQGYTQSCQTLQVKDPTEVFTCTSGGDACTLKKYECDSVKDCPDFSDEDHCTSQHAESCVDDFEGKVTSNGQPLQSFKCDDGMCILGCYRCDEFDDCSDGSDEIGCTENETMPPCQ